MNTIKFDKKNVKVIAHRGLSGIETENTNSAFVAAGNRSYFGIETDILLEDMDLNQLEMIVLPGGLGGVSSIRASQKAMDTIRFAYENNKYTAAICAGPTVLADLGITDGKSAVCYPGCEENMGSATVVNAPYMQDGKVITGASAGCATAFGLALIQALKGEDAAKAIAKQIVIRTQEV